MHTKILSLLLSIVLVFGVFTVVPASANETVEPSDENVSLPSDEEVSPADITVIFDLQEYGDSDPTTGESNQLTINVVEGETFTADDIVNLDDFSVVTVGDEIMRINWSCNDIEFKENLRFYVDEENYTKIEEKKYEIIFTPLFVEEIETKYLFSFISNGSTKIEKRATPKFSSPTDLTNENGEVTYKFCGWHEGNPSEGLDVFTEETYLVDQKEAATGACDEDKNYYAVYKNKGGVSVTYGDVTEAVDIYYISTGKDTCKYVAQIPQDVDIEDKYFLGWQIETQRDSEDVTEEIYEKDISQIDETPTVEEENSDSDTGNENPEGVFESITFGEFYSDEHPNIVSDEEILGFTAILSDSLPEGGVFNVSTEEKLPYYEGCNLEGFVLSHYCKVEVTFENGRIYDVTDKYDEVKEDIENLRLKLIYGKNEVTIEIATKDEPIVDPQPSVRFFENDEEIATDSNVEITIPSSETVVKSYKYDTDTEGIIWKFGEEDITPVDGEIQLRFNEENADKTFTLKAFYNGEECFNVNFIVKVEKTDEPTPPVDTKKENPAVTAVWNEKNVTFDNNSSITISRNTNGDRELVLYYTLDLKNNDASIKNNIKWVSENENKVTVAVNGNKLTVKAVTNFEGQGEAKVNCKYGDVTLYSLNFAYYELSKPTSVTTSVQSKSSVKISWNEVLYAKYYEVKDITNGKVYVVSKNSLVVKGLKAGTSYEFSVRAYYVGARSKINYYSDSVIVTRKVAPSKVAKLSVKRAKNKKSATVKWTKVKGASGYEVSIKKNGKWIKKTTKKITVKFAGLSAGKKYKVRVRAYFNKKVYGAYISKTVKK